jgi:hypothetical protein
MPTSEPWEPDPTPVIPPTFELPEDDEDWRGNEHHEDWPENLAGPEYWLFKKERDLEN